MGAAGDSERHVVVDEELELPVMASSNRVELIEGWHAASAITIGASATRWHLRLATIALPRRFIAAEPEGPMIRFWFVPALVRRVEHWRAHP